ncbi:hypothetical protein DDZ14_02745 [Maritimibacter sp. 55A14]|uniref:hypothetical protein n=1 Tax=Maritimibacter sp. 55A14 TaxID=2174844 RepID=UPI000D621862|nr:hypothetical protein [Maritimibacter sp. 55A14]PWE34093.1 hypothetical protein DDZ14_02745 [Maritimibacter sp. 55A14]
MAVSRFLGIAAASGRVGCVYVIHGRLRDWQISGTASRSPEDAAMHAQRWITRLEPEAVVTEKITKTSHKGEKTRAIIAAMADTAAQFHVYDISVARVQSYRNKYEEAAALAELYPEIKDWLPPERRFYDNEPRNTVLFEALALVHKVLDDPTTAIAASMG